MSHAGLGLDAWWDEPAYHAAQDTFTQRGTFILAKLSAHAAPGQQPNASGHLASIRDGRRRD